MEELPPLDVVDTADGNELKLAPEADERTKRHVAVVSVVVVGQGQRTLSLSK